MPRSNSDETDRYYFAFTPRGTPVATPRSPRASIHIVSVATFVGVGVVLAIMLSAGIVVAALHPARRGSFRAIARSQGSALQQQPWLASDTSSSPNVYIAAAAHLSPELPAAGSRATKPWLSLSADAATALQQNASARQEHWWGCLDQSVNSSCRPFPPAPPLPFHEWKAHAQEVLQATRRFRGLLPFTFFNPKYNSSRFAGPWIENEFIKFFLDSGKSEMFYPLVPLYVQWTDAVRGGEGRGPELLTALLDPTHSMLRRDVLYVTVIQDSLPGVHCSRLRNVLVLTASNAGTGSVPIPLIKGYHLPHNHHYWPPETDPITYHQRKKVFTFVGTDESSTVRRPGQARPPSFRSALLNSTLPKSIDRSVMIYPNDKWQWLLHGTVFALTERAGANFRTAETIQYGRIPVVVYESALPWVPYQHPADLVAPDRRLAMKPSIVSYGAVAAVEAPDGAPKLSPTLALQRVLSGQGTASSISSSGIMATEDELFQRKLEARGRWSSVLNDGGMWGPGGVGFAVRYSDLPAFVCVACEFLLPGSAEVWRHVRTLPLHLYGRGAGRECPCTAEAWTAVGAAVGTSLYNMTLPSDSLVYEMERRVLGVSAQYFTYGSVLRHVEEYAQSPALGALKCVPRAAA